MQHNFQSSWVTDVHSDKRAKLRHDMESDHRGWFLPRDGSSGRWSDSQHVEVMGAQARGIPGGGSERDLELQAIMWTGQSPYPIRSPADYYHDDKIEVKQVGSDMNQFLASKYGHYIQADPFRSPLQTMMDYKREEQDPNHAVSEQDLANRYSVHVSDMDSYLQQMEESHIHISREGATTRDKAIRNHRGPTRGVAFAATGIPADNFQQPPPRTDFHDGNGGTNSDETKNPHPVLPPENDEEISDEDPTTGPTPDEDPSKDESKPNTPPEDHEAPKQPTADASFPRSTDHSPTDYQLLVNYDLLYAASKAAERAGKEFSATADKMNVNSFKSMFAPIMELGLQGYTDFKLGGARRRAPQLKNEVITKIGKKVADYNHLHPDNQLDPYTVLESISFVRQGVVAGAFVRKQSGEFQMPAKGFSTKNVDFSSVAVLSKPRHFRTTTKYKEGRQHYIDVLNNRFKPNKQSYEDYGGTTDGAGEAWIEAARFVTKLITEKTV